MVHNVSFWPMCVKMFVFFPLVPWYIDGFVVKCIYIFPIIVCSFLFMVYKVYYSVAVCAWSYCRNYTEVSGPECHSGKRKGATRYGRKIMIAYCTGTCYFP